MTQQKVAALAGQRCQSSQIVNFERLLRLAGSFLTKTSAISEISAKKCTIYQVYKRIPDLPVTLVSIKQTRLKTGFECMTVRFIKDIQRLLETS